MKLFGVVQTLRYARQVRLVGLLVPAVRVRQMAFLSTIFQISSHHLLSMLTYLHGHVIKL